MDLTITSTDKLIIQNDKVIFSDLTSVAQDLVHYLELWMDHCLFTTMEHTIFLAALRCMMS